MLGRIMPKFPWRIYKGAVFICLLISLKVHARPLREFSGSNPGDTEWSTVATNLTETETITASRPIVINAPCPQECFCFLDSVAHCSRANLTRIPCEQRESGIVVLSKFPPTVKELHFSNNLISRLSGNCFLASGSRYQTLYLQNNQIETIDHNAFQGMIRLKFIDLRNNNVSSIVHGPSNLQQSVFIGLEGSLQSLQLSNNKIRNIPNKSFANFLRLEVLEMSSNEIEWIAVNAFQDLTALRILRLRNNPLNQITLDNMEQIIGCFSRPMSTQNVYQDLYYSDSYTDEINTIQNITSPEQTSNSGEESLKTLDLGKLGLRKTPGTLPGSLVTLWLDGNRIERISKEAFSRTKQLNILHLAHNGLHEIEQMAFRDLNKLSIFDLSNNRLANLSSDVFYGLGMLVRLRLHKNRQLTELPEKVFRDSPHLQILNLHDCALRSLPNGPWMHRLYALTLYGNPFHCTCQTAGPVVTRLHYRNEKNTYTTKLLVLDPYRMNILDDQDSWVDQRREDAMCHSPPQFAGRRFVDIRMQELQCSPSDWLRITIDRRLTQYVNDYEAGDLDYDADMNLENLTSQLSSANFDSQVLTELLEKERTMTRRESVSNLMNDYLFPEGTQGFNDSFATDSVYGLNSADITSEGLMPEPETAGTPAESDDIALRSSVQRTHPQADSETVASSEETTSMDGLIDSEGETRWMIELPSSAEESILDDGRIDGSGSQRSEQITEYSEQISEYSEQTTDNSEHTPEYSEATPEYPIYQPNYDEVMYSGDVTAPSFEEEVTTWMERDNAAIYRSLLEAVDMGREYEEYNHDDHIEGINTDSDNFFIPMSDSTTEDYDYV
ncbi:uncharacterized protein LOC100183114 [Ciona intestinalis]